MRRSFVLLAIAAFSAACSPATPDPQTEPTPTGTATATAAPTVTASAEATATATATASTAPTAPPKPAAPPPAVRFAGSFATPESVYYDEANDRYLVSNINGKPVDVDNNGFISELSPDGKITNAKWIEGGKGKVKLDAPKGMAIVGGVLYVADLTVVRMFDAKSGAPKGEVAIKDATFLNDVSAGPDGKVYVSDTGVKMGANGFEPTGTDAVYVIEKNKAKPLAKSVDLGKPNGLLATDKGVWVVTFGSGEMYRLDPKGAKQDVAKLPKGQLDGIVPAGDNILVSSWEAPGIFKGKPGATFELIIPEIKAPADIGFDKKRSRVLVPRFMEDAVEAYDVK